jgi:hypothetical protein
VRAALLFVVRWERSVRIGGCMHAWVLLGRAGQISDE